MNHILSYLYFNHNEYFRRIEETDEQTTRETTLNGQSNGSKDRSPDRRSGS